MSSSNTDLNKNAAIPVAGGLPFLVAKPPREFIDLQELQEKLLAPRTIERDVTGYLTHPDLPLLDESARIDTFLAAFGMDSAFVGMECDCPEDERVDAYFNGDVGCAWWEPTPPEGEGWALLEIYDTENGPYALFARKTPKVTPLSRRARRQAEEAAQAAARVELAKTREGWQVSRVENQEDLTAMEQARASWEAFDEAQLTLTPDVDAA